MWRIGSILGISKIKEAWTERFTEKREKFVYDCVINKNEFYDCNYFMRYHVIDTVDHDD